MLFLVSHKTPPVCQLHPNHFSSSVLRVWYFAHTILSPHHGLSFANTTLNSVMPGTRSLVELLNNSQIDGTDLCLVSKQALEALMDNVTSLTKTNEDIASSMKTLTKILNKQEVNFKDLATKLDTLNELLKNYLYIFF